MSTAYLLVAHGSRDPRPQIALDRLTYLVGEYLSASSSVGDKSGQGNENIMDHGDDHNSISFPTSVLTKVGQRHGENVRIFSASLEAQTLPLHQQLVNLGEILIDQGIKELKILPLFLLLGVHTCEDLPQEIAQAQTILGSKLHLCCLPILGLYPWFPILWEQCFAQYQQQPNAQRILLAHGSKRVGANQAIAKVAERLGARAAYWKGGISLSETLGQLRDLGEVTIVPYFLFTGGLTDLIRNQLEELQHAHPHLRLNFGEPLGPSPMLAQFIAKELQRV